MSKVIQPAKFWQIKPQLILGYTFRRGTASCFIWTHSRI